eukprot:1075856-Amphidinium_carterae.1
MIYADARELSHAGQQACVALRNSGCLHALQELLAAQSHINYYKKKWEEVVFKSEDEAIGFAVIAVIACVAANKSPSSRCFLMDFNGIHDSDIGAVELVVNHLRRTSRVPIDLGCQVREARLWSVSAGNHHMGVQRRLRQPEGWPLNVWACKIPPSLA